MTPPHYDGNEKKPGWPKAAVVKRTGKGQDEILSPADFRQEWLDSKHIDKCSEGDLIKALILRFRWVWLDKQTLRRFNPFNINVQAIVEADDAEAS